MAKYRIIGKSRHMTSVYLLQHGRFKQHRIISGKVIDDIDESELTFHVDRLVAKKDIKLVKIEEEAEVEVKPVLKPTPTLKEVFVTEETPAVNIDEIDDEEPVPVSKKGRGRKKKIQEPETEPEPDSEGLL